ncbi:MAG: DNA mismatch repair protein MutT [Pseudomonadota bacterium]
MSDAAPSAERPIRDAASVIAVRRAADGAPRVLMGRRGKAAAFMPAKVVFPGGAVDAGDYAAAETFPPEVALSRRLGQPRDLGGADDPSLGAALVLTALRELWEETGIAPRGGPYDAPGMPEAWRGYCARHGAPRLNAFTYIFRAVTPVGRPRRFDARFLMIDADCLNHPDDFSAADGELADLGWRTIEEALAEDLPFVTALVLAEVDARLGAERPGETRGTETLRAAPFFRHDGTRSVIDPA